MMNDLINRQDVLALAKDVVLQDGCKHRCIDATMIHELPSAEPEIIRCKDCKYGEPNGQYGCKCYHYKLYETHEMTPNDFCSHAERRTDETD